MDGPRNTRNTRKGEDPTAPDRRNPGPVISLLSLLSARFRVIRGLFIRVIRVIRVIRGCSSLVAAAAAPSPLRFLSSLNR